MMTKEPFPGGIDWVWRTFLCCAFVLLCSAAFLLTVAIAYAQAPQPAPCVRGASPATDELKCELAVVKQERAMSMERVDKLLAAATLLTNDLEAARTAAAKREADLAAWFKGQFGEGK